MAQIHVESLRAAGVGVNICPRKPTPWLVQGGPCRLHLLPTVRFQVRSVLLPWATELPLHTYDIGNVSALMDTHLSSALHPDLSLS